ncbi:transcription antitermination factor NusB [Candidatus Methylacidiphilum fumarolicum]|uniref:Transcription antitermination protein NusB n=2 Tax=Candidatus Methylacidiphilum fumarolicum TaxID=591154 RepID=I0JZK3_METFB|nr:transcription antitermination factor NusB [Candidatus Methylacidiphilum fumarolicum]TFE69012.1 transcription antitermination factor NusB [Candidatus Methylacidiphilum fumarolicum]TFE74157.1 transcription antitermination factor NusB [Candidatus Methylacidiphilum fumarolicum]CCG92672.1 N utilization substance protein B homolog [Methylacidiphilum fumariolicum SolV]
MVLLMTSRRKIRELIIQFLYQWEMNKESPFEQILSLFWDVAEIKEEDKKVVEEWIRDIVKRKKTIEEKINSYIKNWSLDRLAIVDKCILMLGIYEILYRKDIPPAVTINESVEIAKKYSTEASGKFVNGVLDAIRKESGRQAWITSS